MVLKEYHWVFSRIIFLLITVTKQLVLVMQFWIQQKNIVFWVKNGSAEKWLWNTQKNDILLAYAVRRDEWGNSK